MASTILILLCYYYNSIFMKRKKKRVLHEYVIETDALHKVARRPFFGGHVLFSNINNTCLQNNNIRRQYFSYVFGLVSNITLRYLL